MPNHHSGSKRYENPPTPKNPNQTHFTKPKTHFKKPEKEEKEFFLPALTPEAAAALLRPFFLIMKLAPINALDDKAKTNPFKLS
jgi:hypothetical protein